MVGDPTLHPDCVTYEGGKVKAYGYMPWQNGVTIEPVYIRVPHRLRRLKAVIVKLEFSTGPITWYAQDRKSYRRENSRAGRSA